MKFLSPSFTPLSKSCLWLLPGVPLLFLFAGLPLHAQIPGQAPEPVPLPHPEIAPPEIPPAPMGWWPIVLGAVAVLFLLGLVIGLLFLLRKDTPQQAVSPLKIALGRLEELQGSLSKLPPSEVAHQVSLILRDYLQGRYAVPAPYRTSEELYGAKAIQAREGIAERFAPIAELQDRIEFAPAPTTLADSTRLVDQALQVLKDEKRYSPGVMPPPVPKDPPSLPFVPTKM